MRSFIRSAAVAAGFAVVVSAIDGVTVPDTVAAGEDFEITFANAGSSHYRVSLAAAVVAGARGPACYLINDTTLESPTTLNIPAVVGPSADYYSIAVADLSTGQGATYSPSFNLTGGIGNITEYEEHLSGAPFWSAADLPCTAFQCARTCAQTGYPDDLTEQSAYDTMKACILRCPGVTAKSVENGPANGGSSSSRSTITGALITIGSKTYTAIPTTVTSGGSTMTEAVIAGSRTLTLGGDAWTTDSAVVTLESSGLNVNRQTTVAFSNVISTVTTTDEVSAATTSTDSSAGSASTGAAATSRRELGVAGAAIAGLAAAAFL